MVNEGEQALRDRLNKLNFSEGGFTRTPLREFLGVFDGYDLPLSRDGRQQIIPRFSDVKVIDSIEPYDFLTATLPPMNVAVTRDGSFNLKSLFGIWGQSIKKLLHEDQGLEDTIGLRHHLKMTPGHLIFNRDQGREVERDAWEVIAIEGVGEAIEDAATVALQLLDGKTEQEWNSIVLKDKIVQSSDELKSSILKRSFIPESIKQAKITKDKTGRYHLKQ